MHVLLFLTTGSACHHKERVQGLFWSTNQKQIFQNSQENIIEFHDKGLQIY